MTDVAAIALTDEASHKLTYADAARRSVATFVSAAVASPLGSVVFNVAWWKAAGLAGLAALVNLGGRSAQAWLQKHPEVQSK